MSKQPDILISGLDLKPGEDRSQISDRPIVSVPVMNVCTKDYRLKDETYEWLNKNVGWQNARTAFACWDFILAESSTGLATFRFLDEKKAAMFRLFFG